MATKTLQSTTRQIDLGRSIAMVEKGQQLAGHFPDDEALARARQVLDGTRTEDDALAEVAAKYGFPLRQY